MDGLKTAFGPKVFDPGFPVAVRIVESGDHVELGGDSTLSVVKTPHTAESLAVRIESAGRALCYTGDTAYDDELPRFFKGAEVLVSECSFREPKDDVCHLSVCETARLANQASVSRLIVTHFYFEVDEAALKKELARDYRGEVIIGRDGFSIEV